MRQCLLCNLYLEQYRDSKTNLIANPQIFPTKINNFFDRKSERGKGKDCKIFNIFYLYYECEFVFGIINDNNLYGKLCEL